MLTSPRSLTVLAAPLLAWACDGATHAAEEGFHFVDVAPEAGIDVVNRCGDPRRWYIPESNGNGAAWLDFDGDDDVDLFVGNGSGVRYVDDGARLELLNDGSSRLYRNDGDGTFTDVTDACGARTSAWINAVTVGDVDEDGDPDLYLACFGPDLLLRNDGGTFVDATAEAGLGCELWGAGATFGDADNDGDLDLYVANYVEFDLEAPPEGGRRQTIEGVEIGYGPEAENGRGLNPGAPDRFYLGDGRGRFVEATADAGLELPAPLCSYAVLFSDVDGDGWQDLMVANDLQPANLFMNRGDGTFEDQGDARGFARNAQAQATAAMGLFSADFDGDGDFDVFRTNFDFEANALHVNDGRGHFRDRAAELGLAQTSEDRLGWGGGFFDADLDGDLDLLVANGHVLPQAPQIGMNGFLQESQLFEAYDDDGRLRYRDVTADAGADLRALRSARGVALADYDDDGDVDALIVDLDHAPRLLENRSARRGHWLAVALEGTTSNRDALGAVVTVSAGGRDHAREMRVTDGLYSSHDARLHFGLGAVDGIERVTVRWPSGARTTIDEPPLDRLLSIREPQKATK